MGPPAPVAWMVKRFFQGSSKALPCLDVLAGKTQAWSIPSREEWSTTRGGFGSGVGLMARRDQKQAYGVASCHSAVRKVLGTPVCTQAPQSLLCWVRAAVLPDSPPGTLLGFPSLPYRNLVISSHFFLPCLLTIREAAAVIVLPALQLYRLT